MSGEKRILIVDDSILSRSLLSSNISNAEPNWKLVQATCGTEALDSMASDIFDFYIVDYNMPGMDGIELAQEIKKRDANAKIALCTANIQSSIQEKAENIGVQFLNKPVDTTELNSFLGL